MKKHPLAFLVLAFALTLSACEDKEARNQNEALKNVVSEVSKKIQAIEAENKTLSTEVAQSKQLLQKFSEAIGSQNAAIEQLNKSIVELTLKMERPAVPAAAPARKKKR